MSFLKPIDKNLFFSKNDPQDIRLGEVFKPLHLEQIQPTQRSGFALIGYPDDEGIKLNGGRIGAADAPNKIRESLYKMTPSIDLPTLNQNDYYDIGNLDPKLLSLEERHQHALNSVESIYKNGLFPITLGGGHDYGYPDAAAFVKSHSLPGKPKPVVLNFDAHMDVRPTSKSGFNSGTPFFRLLTDYAGQFEFAEIGIQPQCNSLHHKAWAVERGAQIFELSFIEQSGGLVGLLEQPFFQKLTPDTPVLISFDIDGLTSSEAGGCSQAWVTGLQTNDFLKFFKKLSHLCQVKGLGIYEVSPVLDVDNRTSKTAALIAYSFLFQRYL